MRDKEITSLRLKQFFAARKKLAVQMFFFISGALRACGIAPGDYF